MVRTLTLNPAVDKTVTVERFSVGRVNRIASVRLDAGGKGLNVARVLHRLGTSAVAVAPVAGAAGRFLGGRMAEEGVPHDFLEVGGETRTNLKVVDPVLGTHTDINEPGPLLGPADLETLGSRLLEGLGPDDWAVFSGSVPLGVSPDLYGAWIARARSRGIRTALDAEGELLARGLGGRPDLVKPNREELEAWAGRVLETDGELLEAAADLRAAGAGTVALTLGARGAWLVGPDGVWFAPGLGVRAVSTVGAGDAFLGALIDGLARNLSPECLLARAAAAGTAAVVQPGAGAGDPGLMAEFYPQIRVIKTEF